MKRLGIVILIAGLLTGCGYAFQGTALKAPEGVRRMHIPAIANTTTHSELTLSLTNKLIQQFNLSKVVKVTSADLADSVLQVTVEYVQIEGAARVVSEDASASRRVIVSVGAQFTRKEDGRVIWESKNITGRKTYTVSADQSVVEANLSSALQDVAGEIASKIHDGIFEGF